MPQLRTDVEALAAPSGRRVGTSGHEQAKSYLEGRLAELALEPYADGRFALGYRSGGIDFTNLVAVAPGRDRSLAPLLVGAHYDTVPSSPGADDNAAAVGIALAVAERLKAEPAQRDVVVALFDAEEPPYFQTSSMGSTRFFHDQRLGPVQAALVLDLVGHDVPLPGLEDLLFITGMESSEAFEPLVAEAGVPSGLRIVPTLNSYVGNLSDHHVFERNGVPFLFFSCGRWAHYHAPTDTPEKLNYGKMALIAELLEGLVRKVGAVGAASPGSPLPTGPYDSTATELRFMNRALGPLAQQLGIRLEGRGDIDQLAQRLLTLFQL